MLYNIKIRISLYHSMKIREMGYSTKNSAQLSEQNMSVGFGGRVTVFWWLIDCQKNEVESFLCHKLVWECVVCFYNFETALVRGSPAHFRFSHQKSKIEKIHKATKKRNRCLPDTKIKRTKLPTSASRLLQWIFSCD